MRSVATAAGISGVNTLRTQTIELLNGKSVEKGESEHRFAYNLVPELTGSVIGTNILQELTLATGDNTEINVTAINKYAGIFWRGVRTEYRRHTKCRYSDDC